MHSENESIKILCEEFKKNNQIDPSKYEKYNVKRGLRNNDGTGVLAGLTLICNVHGYVVNEGEKAPCEGELTYRGININDIVEGCTKSGRYCYEEVCWLLLFGSLPTAEQLNIFSKLLSERRAMPANFAENIVVKAPSASMMNMLARSTLALYSYDDNPEDNSLENVLRQSIEIIAKLPSAMCTAYRAQKGTLGQVACPYLPLDTSLSTAETILSSIRVDRKYTKEEARLLDLCLMLHAEHGGGNNSTFACRVLSSSMTDTYSAISASIGSLKGARHGGANIKVNEMLEFIKRDVEDPTDEAQLRAYLEKILRKEAGDGTGLIYGMGHAVYTMSDPRAKILKKNAEKLAYEKGFGRDFQILSLIEKITPEIFAARSSSPKMICANVDLYSGLVYRTLGVSEDLFTPLFAISRIAGWCAHRIEEITSCNRIMRPAYKAIVKTSDYIPLEER